MSQMTGARGVARILGGKAVLKREVRSLGDLQRLVANGLPVRTLDRFGSGIDSCRPPPANGESSASSPQRASASSGSHG